jgi:hypothetical protein
MRIRMMEASERVYRKAADDAKQMAFPRFVLPLRGRIVDRDAP